VNGTVPLDMGYEYRVRDGRAIWLASRKERRSFRVIGAVRVMMAEWGKTGDTVSVRAVNSTTSGISG